MVVGSLIAGFTSELLVMIVGRALQGFAMGAIPLGIGLMRDMLPREKLGSAMALMSSSIGVGGGLALPVAALVAQHADWHALFFVAAGLGVLSIVLTLVVVPESPMRAEGTFDVLGRDRPLRRPRPLPAADHQGQRLGLDLRHHARPVRRGGRRPRSCGA